jgi:signal transduction histidine kinase
MIEPSTLSTDERERYLEFDRQRGQRLSFLVGVTFGGCCLVAALALGVHLLIAPTSLSPASGGMVAALLACAALYGLAAVLARRGVGLPAAALIGVSSVLVAAAFQLARESVAGVDVLVVAAYAAYTIPIGLSGVVGSPRLMFVTTIAITTISATTGLAIPTHFQFDRLPANLILMVVIATGVHWLVAVLIYGASTLYIQTMSELGDIRIALERARQLDALKDQFITNVNHELRTPIMAMRGYIELLRLRHGTMSPERREELIDKASLAGNDLVALMTNILDAQHLEQTTKSGAFQPVSLYEVLESAARLIDPLEGDREGNLVERDLRVRIPARLTVLGEPTWLRQIFINLLSNAIKYSDPGTPVEVTAEIEPQHSTHHHRADEQHAYARVLVRDLGLGIPPAQAPLLFNRFTRLPRDLASTVIGNGLGLYISRVLVEAMGGRIWVESSGVPGEGSAFWFTLPLARSEPAPVPQEPARIAFR